MTDHRPYRKWYMARRDADRRGIPFLLTFRAWLAIWNQSGHWHERGLGKGQYVMGRFDDMGSYEIGNVKIVTSAENTREGRLGKKFTLLGKIRASQRRRGKTHSKETIAKIVASNIKTYSDSALRERVARRRGKGRAEELMALAYALV